MAVDGPGEHGAAVDVLDEAGELAGVAGTKFAGGESVVEEFFRLVEDDAELREKGLRLGQVGCRLPRSGRVPSLTTLHGAKALTWTVTAT